MDVYDIGCRIGEEHDCIVICNMDPMQSDGVYLCILKCARRGTGSACLKRFIHAMNDLGFRKIRLDAYPSRYPTGHAPYDAVRGLVHWYEKFGFRLQRGFRPDYYNEMVLAL
jgi:hypothetical protein